MNTQPSVSVFITRAYLICKTYFNLCDQICTCLHYKVGNWFRSFKHVDWWNLIKQSVTVGAMVAISGPHGCAIVMSHTEINKVVTQWPLTFSLCLSVTRPLICAFHITYKHTPEIIDMHRGMYYKYKIKHKLQMLEWPCRALTANLYFKSFPFSAKCQHPSSPPCPHGAVDGSVAWLLTEQRLLWWKVLWFYISCIASATWISNCPKVARGKFHCFSRTTLVEITCCRARFGVICVKTNTADICPGTETEQGLRGIRNQKRI